MIIIFTNHAKKRLQERDIGLRDVKITVSNSDFKKRVDLDRILVRKSFGKKILEIIYIEESNKIIIITAYYL
ncbi:DUF4258 domain-containing protein [Candidatus Parcubacteria bacterium]|nr:DUF4258 domain-containing protein [Candidatus Parcubacteria bacterium]